MLLLFLGAFGAHKFYAGRKGGYAVLLLLTLSGFALLILTEVVPAGGFSSPDGNYSLFGDFILTSGVPLSFFLFLICLVILVSNFFRILAGHFRDGTGLKMKQVPLRDKKAPDQKWSGAFFLRLAFAFSASRPSGFPAGEENLRPREIPLLRLPDSAVGKGAPQVAVFVRTQLPEGKKPEGIRKGKPVRERL